jgi:hypothetical protein
MKINIEVKGTYPPGNGAATGKPFGRVGFTCNDGRHYEAIINVASQPSSCYTVDCFLDGSPKPFLGDSIVLELPFEQAACVVAGMMLHVAAETRKEIDYRAPALLGMTCPKDELLHFLRH